MQRSKGGAQGRGVKLKPILPAVKQPPEKGTSDKPLTGRIFYLDIPSKLLSEKFEKDIKDLGGTVEGFLSKEISCLITSKKEAKCTKSLKYSCSMSSPEPAQNTGSSSARAGSRRGGIQEERSNKKPEKDDVSRGKSLLKKVIKEQEILPKNSILANAWNWGVRILHVDDAKLYIEQKKRLCQHAKQPETASKPVVKQPVKRKAKAQKLKSPYIKVEDSCGQYRPLYLVLPCFRSFQSPPSKPCQSMEKKAATTNKATEAKHGLNKTWHGQDGANNSHCKLREQKKRGYCECCLQKYEDLEAHLVSQTHTTFSLGPYYQDVDNLISMFDFDFVDWSIYKQEAKSSPMLLPTVTVKWEEKEISDRYLRMSQKISSSVKQTPETIQRTESEVPLAAANDSLVNHHIPSLEPMESSICPVQTLGNNASATDSEVDPPGMPALLPVTENSLLPAGDTITVCNKDCKKNITHSVEHTPQELTLGLLLTATAIRKCSSEHGDGIPSKKIKLDASLLSATLYSEPVDADHVTSPTAIIDTVPGGLETCPEPVDADHIASPKPVIDTIPVGWGRCAEPVNAVHVVSSNPVIDTVPGGLETCTEPVNAAYVVSPKPVIETVPGGLKTTISNHSDTLHDQSLHSSPKLHRKVKLCQRKSRIQENLHSTPECKVSVPVEEFEFSSPREGLLSLFESSGMESEFCGFSCKSESFPHSIRLETEPQSSSGDFHWCLFSTTSSSAGTFHGF